MKNLYKRRIPKRSHHETVVDILRMDDNQWKQFQGLANQFSGGSLFHESIRKPKKKIKPSSWKTIADVDSPSTLAALIAMQKTAHDDPDHEFHMGGGLYEAASSLFSGLWNTIGLGPEFNNWFNFFDYDAPENMISRENQDYARIVSESYKPIGERSDQIDDWVRDKSLDNERFSVWVDEEDHKVHVGLRGTKANASDVISDLHILWDNQSGKADEVADFLQIVQDKYEGYSLDAAAHSLGANQLLDVSLNNPNLNYDNYHLFNPGLNPMWKLDDAKEGVNNEKHHFYLNSGDVISNGFVPLLNDTTNVSWSRPGHNPASNHSISQWVEI